MAYRRHKPANKPGTFPVETKKASCEYGKEYQERMLGHHWQSKVASDSNAGYLRLVFLQELTDKYALPRLNFKAPHEITLVDIGCSIGTFAIEFAKKGFNSFGLDFDPAALELAKKLNEQEGAGAKFIQMDISNWRLDMPIDIALCFDIFEHLHDDELGAFLYGIKKNLSEKGCLVFHTAPLQYDYLFWDETKGIIRFPPLLRPFINLPPRHFSRIVKIYALCLDIYNLCRGRGTQQEAIKTSRHPNPLTRERLEGILSRQGYEIIFMESGFLGEAQLDPKHRKYFHKHPITHRSLWGVAVPLPIFLC